MRAAIFIMLMPLLCPAAVSIYKPEIALKSIQQDIILKVDGADNETVYIEGAGSFRVKEGAISIKKFVIPEEISGTVSGKPFKLKVPRISGWLSLLPPFVAIFFAFLLREVFISLFLGVYIGVLFLKDFNFLKAFYSCFNDKFAGVLADISHIKILMFTLGMAAFIGILRKSGALVDLVDRIKSFISTPKSGMLATWMGGLVIFFDDYANSLLIGNMLRPLTDKLRISREKLSYIVDATAAPVASLALSTWIGTEISLMQDAYSGIDPSVSGMALFIGTIPYRFYSILTIFFVFFICFLNRDFGPMKKAEIRARETGKVLADDAVPLQDYESEEFMKNMKNGRWYLAAISIVAMIVFIVGFIYYSGASVVGVDSPLNDILSNSETSSSLMSGPIIGILVFWVIGGRLFKLNEIIDTLIQGAKTVLIAVFILTLAWSIGLVCREIGTATFLISLFGDKISPVFLPAMTFVLSAITAFATGTSWGTMAIMFPIIVPLVHHVLGVHEVSPEISSSILYGTMGSILAGACLGDHSSPISDTTLFSSMASASDHIHHVKTQIPYALSAGAVSIFAGYIPIAMGVHWSISLIVGILMCFLIVRFVGKKNPS